MTIFTKWVFLTVFLVGLVFGQGARAQSTDMEVVSIGGTCSAINVLTSGAKFSFNKNLNRIDIESRINVETNTLYTNVADFRLVARLNFNNYNLGSFELVNVEDNPDTPDVDEEVLDNDCSYSTNNNMIADGYGQDKVVIKSDLAYFEIHNNGLLFVTAITNFKYNAIDMLADPDWNVTIKGLPNPNPDGLRSNLDRIWVKDGKGGSLYAIVEGSPDYEELNTDPDNLTRIVMDTNATPDPADAEIADKMAHMIFPARLYDFEKLYGATSRPFVQHVGGPLLKSFLHKRIKGQLSSGATAYSPYTPRSTAEIDEIFNRFSQKRIGVFMISGTVYEGACENDLLNKECLPPADPLYKPGDCRGCVPTQPRDIIMPDDSTQRGYKVRTDLIVNIGHALSLPSGSAPSPDTSYSTDLKAFIAAAHARGFKVISYTVSPAIKTWWKDVPLTPIKDCEHIGGGGISNMDWMNDTVFHWMKELHETSNAGVGEADKGFGYDFDGWYLDSSDAGDFMVDYSFIRQVRQEVGSDGIIYMHDSIDPWARNLNPGASAANLSGLKAVFLRTYADYSLSGEVSGKTSTNPDEYFAQVDTLDQDYYKYFTNGYGMDQAFCGHKLMSIGVSEVQNEDNYRAMGENYYCAQRATYVKALERTSNGGSEVTLAPVVGDKFWNEYFFPAHEELGSTYSSAPPVLENSTDWYKSFIPSSLAYGTISDSGSFSVSWKTVGVECDFDLNDYTAKEIEKHLVLFKGAKLALVDNLNPDPARWGGATKVAGVTIPAAILGATITDGVGFGTTHTTTFTNVSPAGEYKMLFRCETRDKSLVPQKVFQHIRTDTITIP